MQHAFTPPDYKQLYEEQLRLNKLVSMEYEEYLERHADVQTSQAELLQAHQAERQLLQDELTALKWELAWLRRQMYGVKREYCRFDEKATARDIQLSLDLEAETVAQCRITAGSRVSYLRSKAEITRNKPKLHPGRQKLPDHLRREAILLKPDLDVAGLQRMGEDVTEILDYIPSELYVKQYIRPKYAAPVGDGGSTVITASLPGRVMEKCMAGEGLVAQMVVDKYVDHLAVHRQLQRYGRMGVNIAQSTSNDWIRMALNHLHSLYDVHKKRTLDTGYLSADETPIRVLDEDKKGSTHRGHYWVYYNSVDRLVLFDYRPGRGREDPEDILQGFQGYLQTDGYSAYEDFDKRAGVTVMHCMAHARRKFHEAQGNDKDRAEHALKMFQALYAIERTCREESLDADATKARRQSQALPILKEMKQWMEQEYVKLGTPKSPIAAAMAYCMPRWDKLSIYTQDGRLNMENNPVENAIRPVAVGRKNFLFAGSHEAAQRAAMIYSLMATCKLHNVDPYKWLKDVLEHLHLHNTSNIHQLLPQFWQELPTWDMG